MLKRIYPGWPRRLSTAATLVEKPQKKEEEPIMVVPRLESKQTFQKRAIVTLLGSHNKMGHITATCLKLKGKHVSEIRMWDTGGSLRGVALEMGHIPTSTRVLPFVGRGQLQMALRNADIVMMMGGYGGLPKEAVADLFSRNSAHLRDMTNAVISNAPKAVVGITLAPVMPNLAYFCMVQRMQGSFCPNKVFGVMSLDEMRARTLAAVKLGLPPGTVRVHLTGGATPDTVVPVMSSAQPGGEFLKPDLVELMNLMRGMTDNIKQVIGSASISAGHSTANFIASLAQGLVTDETVTLSAAVRNSTLFGVPYLTLPVTVGRAGVVGTSGIPRLTNTELKALIRALPSIVEHISMGEAAATQKDSTQDDQVLDLY